MASSCACVCLYTYTRLELVLKKKHKCFQQMLNIFKHYKVSWSYSVAQKTLVMSRKLLLIGKFTKNGTIIFNLAAVFLIFLNYFTYTPNLCLAYIWLALYFKDIWKLLRLLILLILFFFTPKQFLILSSLITCRLSL